MRTATLFSFLLMLTLSGCSFGDGDILVIPKNFKGYILIIFDQKTGVIPKQEGRKTVYEIPANGILKVQNKTNTGWREFAEFYYEKIAPENKLPAYNISKEMPTGVIGGFEGASGGANKDYKGKDVVRFSYFYVGTKSEVEQYKEQADKLDIVKLAE